METVGWPSHVFGGQGRQSSTPSGDQRTRASPGSEVTTKREAQPKAETSIPTLANVAAHRTNCILHSIAIREIKILRQDPTTICAPHNFLPAVNFHQIAGQDREKAAATTCLLYVYQGIIRRSSANGFI
jgi:hypothetical protein